MQNIVLIGFMGSGKTSLATLLSSRLHMEWIDSDAFIESKEGLSVAQIFAMRGEASFRTLEAGFIESFKQKSGYIISTGGGLPIFNSIEGLGLCIYLKASFDVIAKRLRQSAHNRPLFKNLDEAKALYNQRAPIYENLALAIIEADSSLEEVARLVMKAVGDKAI